MSRKIVITAAILIMLSIVLGAIGAHALKNIASDDLVLTFEKGVRYQFYTAIGLLVIGFNADKTGFRLSPFFLLNLIGVLLFSGGIYLYSLHESVSFFKSFVAIVPFGGVSLISAWVIIIIQFIRHKG